MAIRRVLQTLIRQYSSSIRTLNPLLQSLPRINQAQSRPTKVDLTSIDLCPKYHAQFTITRHFSTNRRDDSDNDEDEDDEDDEDEDEDEDDEDEDDEDENDDKEMGDSVDDDVVSSSKSRVKRGSTLLKEENEAAAIGYKVVGPLQPYDLVFKDYEPVFAVIQIGSLQFKVSNGDCLFVERLKFCEVHDKIILNKVLMLGSASQTLIGRPLLSDATVHAVVEEHALDAKVIIFKKKRRKNYRRKNGHRQELTKLRITDIQGIEKPVLEKTRKTRKTRKTATKTVEKKVAVAA